MNLIVVKKAELIKAYQRWNIDVIKNPQNHEEPNDTIEDAEMQVDEMLSHIADGHIVETTKEILRKINSVYLCMSAHPDNQPGSEFEDRISNLKEIYEALTGNELEIKP